MDNVKVLDPKRVIFEYGRSRDKPIIITLPCLMDEEDEGRRVLLERLARTFAECGYEIGLTLLCKEDGSEALVKRCMKLCGEVDDLHKVMYAEMEKRIDFSAIAKRMLAEANTNKGRA